MEAFLEDGRDPKKESSRNCWEFEEINPKSEAVTLGLGIERSMASGTQRFDH